MKLLLGFLPLLGLLSSEPASAQAAHPIIGIDSVVDAYAGRGDFSGVVVIADHGDVIYERAVGFANREWRVPMTVDAVFRIGSTSKQFTAALVLMYVESGDLKLDDPINVHLANDSSSHWQGVTVRQLLTHSTGIPDYVTRDSFVAKHAPVPTTITDLIRRIAPLASEFEPGHRWAYSNSNYVLLAAILERLSGKSLAELIQDRIAEPLGMHTLAFDDDAIVSKRAYGYFNFGDPPLVEAHVDASSAYGAGMLRASARDLLRWDEALLHSEVFESPATGIELVTGRMATDTPLGEYGFGVFNGMQDLSGRTVRVIQHGGTISGFVTGYWRIPEDRRVIIVLSNTRSPRTGEMVGDIAKALYMEN